MGKRLFVRGLQHKMNGPTAVTRGVLHGPVSTNVVYVCPHAPSPAPVVTVCRQASAELKNKSTKLNSANQIMERVNEERFPDATGDPLGSGERHAGCGAAEANSACTVLKISCEFQSRPQQPTMLYTFCSIFERNVYDLWISAG